MADDADSAAVPDLQTKACTRCGEMKPVGEFSPQARGKFGCKAECKRCIALRAKTHREANPDKVAASASSYRASNPDKIKESSAAWALRNADKIKDGAAKRYADNPEKFILAAAKWRVDNPERVLKTAKMWRQNNPESHKIAISAWRDSNPEKMREMAARKRAKPRNKVSFGIRSAISASVVSGSKKASTFALLGYSRDELMAHLECQFMPGMTWENYGPTWHIDHILPLASFSYKTPDCPDFKKAWALSNLQPLWAVENLSKGARLDHPSQMAMAA